MSVWKFLLITALIISAVSCSSFNRVVTNPVVERLKNRGPITLSADNPYVSSNMMLQKVMDESADVRGFVQHRGAPTVLEVRQEFLSVPIMFFYYPENGEYYRLEQDSESWLIEGPFRIDEEKLAKLKPLTQVQLSTQEKLQPAPPPARIKSRPEPAEPEKPKAPEPKKTPEFAETTEGIALEKEPGEFPLPPQKASPSAVKEKPPVAPKNADQQIVEEVIAGGAHATGELTPKGDLVHYVTYPEEDLALIARWYTFDAWNAGKIARVSGISQKQPLSVGDTLVIPSYLLKNKARLTKEGLDALRASGR